MSRKSKHPFKILILGILLVNAHLLIAQSYGLEFRGMDVKLDSRTELNLTPNDFLTFQGDFDISFDYKATRINPNSNIGLFGYILRVINKENTNVDILSSWVMGKLELNLNVVVGNENKIIEAPYKEEAINNWIKLRIKFDLAADRMIFYTPDSFYVHDKIGFKNRDDFKIIFGVNDYKQFKTSDVPTMSIRDIRIAENGKLKYHWALDELDSKIIEDKISSRKALVKNPSWLKLNHQLWKPGFENHMDGRSMIATNEEKGVVYIIGEKELTVFSSTDNSSGTVSYINRPGFQDLLFNYRAIYNSVEDKIYCYVIGKDEYFKLDPNTGKWSEIEITISPASASRHHNNYFNPIDNSVYLFGGYGQHKYNNEVRKIDFSNNSRINLSGNDSIYKPKYLAGLGALNDTLYILGGYGSDSGNQLINPQSYYDLIGYSIKDSTFFKKFEIPHIMDDMCVANSMWIDAETRDYYALIFEKSKFKGFLQLIRGNLDKPDFENVGSKIPFKFLDVRSAAGLVYIKQKNKLYAYTAYTTDSTTTQTKIYSINYPPNNFNEEIENTEEASKLSIILGVTVFSILLFVLGFLLYKKRKGLENKSEPIIPGSRIPEEKLIEKPVVKREEVIIEKIEYNLTFFGGFQMVNKNSEDITNHFTPLLKELFLLILLHTFKNNKGISSEKITEILWYDKTDKSAQNNRAVNLAKLRGLLTELGDFKLSKKTGYWKSVFKESDIKSDYVDFLNLTASKSNLTKQKINQLIEIAKKGPFLRNVQYPWLDDFKANVSDKTIDTLIYFANLCDINVEADFIIHLADTIFIFDVTNEDAMMLKCKAQYIMGKHSHAKATYKKFSNEYLEMYGEAYEHSFVDILKIDN